MNLQQPACHRPVKVATTKQGIFYEQKRVVGKPLVQKHGAGLFLMIVVFWQIHADIDNPAAANNFCCERFEKACLTLI